MVIPCYDELRSDAYGLLATHSETSKPMNHPVQLKPGLPPADQCAAIAKIAVLIKGHMSQAQWCICCGANKGKGSVLGAEILKGYEEIGLEIVPVAANDLENGRCYQPLEALLDTAADFLNTKPGNMDDVRQYDGETRLPFKKGSVDPSLVEALEKAFLDEGLNLRIQLN